MPTYLLTWNPHQHPNVPDLGGLRPGSRWVWSCGRRRFMPRGSRVFLLRQGVEPKGIVASGRTTSAVYQDEHWDPEKARSGRKANHVEVRFDVVKASPPNLLPRAILADGILGKVHWDTPSSGIEIPAEAARVLERLWAGDGHRKRAAVDVAAVEGTLTEARHYTRKRDRRLRALALERARGICEACEREYGVLLDGLGHRVLQVHHRRQLGATDAPRITSLKDLAVVCANCHALIHADPRHAIKVPSLRRRLRRDAA
jgi:5-methylcytosine-specific restriction protein A